MQEIEIDKEIQTSVKPIRKRCNFKFTSKSLGELEVRPFTVNKFIKAEQLLEEHLNEREFTIKLIFGLIEEPKFSFDVFQKIPDSELKSIVRRFCENNKELNNIFGVSTDEHFFIEFKDGIQRYRDEIIKKMSINLEGLITPFNLGIEDIGPGVSGLQNLFNQSILPQIKFPQMHIPQIEALQLSIQLNGTYFDNLSKQIEEFSKSLRTIDIDYESADEILKKYKWFLSFSLPISFYFDVLEIENSGNNKLARINKLYLDYFSDENYEELTVLVESWNNNPIFQPRMKIFRSCVQTIKRAKTRDNPSNVVIPVLIAQIDGIQKEIYAKHSIKKKGPKHDLIFFDDFGNESKNMLDAKRRLIKSLNKYSSAGDYLLLDVLFQENKKISIPTTFLRHGILHGEYVNYGRKTHTIRAFLILDFLHYLKGK
ncbi:hypothetical protein L0665_10190 [Methanogenium marinum]|uniref:Uncharacterized protein n=1 Tax=Methanogenium marinum TaxID=348610 RepID=A0A9Q4KWD2_9EURY|nr:hypothetical protein [Methanogenium marinum]MDE4908976.1 hypothetical protein [Methanogenium marinum]